MMKIAGHTMGTPEYSLFEAIDLFKEIGLDGIEIIIQTDGYQCAIPLDADLDYVRKVREKADQAGLAVSGVTPYMNLYNSLDEAEREQSCKDLKRVIDMAVILGAGFVRIYGGRLVDGEADPDGAKLSQLTKSMRECGDYAGERGVKLCLENHFSTMTTSAAKTAGIVAAIDHPQVGILYDQANIAFFPAEEYPEAIELQKDKIFYVHCKDLVYRGGVPQKPKFTMVSHINEEDRTVYSRVPGDGILDWPGILAKLKEIGYDGWVSMEYERRWQPQDLPEAHDGMKRGGDYIRGILQNLEG